MRFFKRNAEDDRRMTCPSCCQLIPVDATSCDLCGADLHDLPESKREGALSASALAGSNSPYSR
jgi:hypothetical protein